jgi:hypothetical protein
VEVWSGTKKLAEYDLKESPAQLAIPVGDINVANGRPVVLGFYLPDAVSPAKLGISPDPRELGLLVVSLEAVP